MFADPVDPSVEKDAVEEVEGGAEVEKRRRNTRKKRDVEEEEEEVTP